MNYIYNIHLWLNCDIRHIGRNIRLGQVLLGYGRYLMMSTFSVRNLSFDILSFGSLDFVKKRSALWCYFPTIFVASFAFERNVRFKSHFIEWINRKFIDLPTYYIRRVFVNPNIRQPEYSSTRIFANPNIHRHEFFRPTTYGENSSTL
jgi:hypothetical protein